MASSASSSATTITSVITMPIAGLPARVRARTNSAAIAERGVDELDHLGAPAEV